MFLGISLPGFLEELLRYTLCIACVLCIGVILLNKFKFIVNCLGGGSVAEWVRVSTGDWTFDGSSPTSVKLFSSKLWQFGLPRLPVSFG